MSAGYVAIHYVRVDGALYTPGEVINADIKLKTDIGDKLRVWGVNAEGFYAGRVPTTYEDGILSFEIGDELNPACYYLIVKE